MQGFLLQNTKSICDLAGSLCRPFCCKTRRAYAIWRPFNGGAFAPEHRGHLRSGGRLVQASLCRPIVAKHEEHLRSGGLFMQAWNSRTQRASAIWRASYANFVAAKHREHLRSGGLPMQAFFLQNTRSICDLAASDPGFRPPRGVFPSNI